MTAEDWRERLELIVKAMREASSESDPQAMVAAYGRFMGDLQPGGAFVSLSRRGVEPPKYVVARSSRWENQPNPWTERGRLPVLEGGLLGELAYSEEVVVIEDLQVDPDDPGYELLAGMGSLITIPIFDEGEARNVVVRMREERNGFDKSMIPTMVWTTNLFGRATHNLVLSRELAKVNAELDKELESVAAIQTSLLPPELPAIPGLDLAVHYQPSRHAGGDYYDFFALPDGKWGLLVADVSGHGVPAAVLMAITHAIAHMFREPPEEPARLLDFLASQLHARYTSLNGAFVTAFYGVYDPGARTLRFASAGHPPPRLKHCDDGTLSEVKCGSGPPLGVLPDYRYEGGEIALRPYDQLVIYTDGIPEARDPAGGMFGLERLDRVIDNCGVNAHALIEEVIVALRGFAAGRPFDDDTTLLVARVQ
ncbi:MAG: PP2C family protein-serine/threonine phosphatase [Planctomycetota bacterium]